jgi:hypothetical protein
MKVTFSIKSEGKDTLAIMVSDLPSIVIPALVRAMAKMGQATISKAQTEHFTGRGPFPVSENKLGDRTGLLRRSLEASRPVVESNGRVSMSMGSQVKYFAIHEFGFSGTMSVAAASVRAFTHPNAFGRGEMSIAAHTRKAHSKQVNMPARRPLGTAIEKYSLAYLERFFTEELNKEFKKN